jgi:hypothetical protein
MAAFDRGNAKKAKTSGLEFGGETVLWKRRPEGGTWANFRHALAGFSRRGPSNEGR